jgi:uncharacterized protein (TIGR03435 family)
MAKVPEGTTRDQFRQMQLNLLIDRFGLKFHSETREVQGYELVVAKDGPKFKESEPETPKAADMDPDAVGQTKPRMKIGEDGLPIMPQGSTGVWMRNGRARGQWSRMSMEEFAKRLFGRSLAGTKPVIDGTGLKGKYDLSLEWTPDRPALTSPAAQVTASIPVEPSGPDIFSALQQQLGLKLQPRKVTVEMLVIDHIEKTPTEN